MIFVMIFLYLQWTIRTSLVNGIFALKFGTLMTFKRVAQSGSVRCANIVMILERVASVSTSRNITRPDRSQNGTRWSVVKANARRLVLPLIHIPSSCYQSSTGTENTSEHIHSDYLRPLVYRVGNTYSSGKGMRNKAADNGKGR